MEWQTAREHLEDAGQKGAVFHFKEIHFYFSASPLTWKRRRKSLAGSKWEIV
ncbi:hypothetical protein ACQCVK_20915 [Rossellomorea vietnamensis]|uniref:hypothetical protein n=1 Tax=Rossellomorea vietnamensis TaxID=218284 RepID=UPI003CF5B660